MLLASAIALPQYETYEYQGEEHGADDESLYQHQTLVDRASYHQHQGVAQAEHEGVHQEDHGHAVDYYVSS